MTANRTLLTELTIKHLGEGTYWDRDLRAFGIRVGKHARTFITVDRRGIKTTVGRWPYVSLKTARQRAKTALYAKYNPKTMPSYSEALDAFLRDCVAPNYKPRSGKEIERLLRKYPLPKLETTARKITELLPPHPSEANHLFAAYKTFLNWAAKQYEITSPIAGHSKPFKEPSRKRTLSDQEIKILWHATEPLTDFHKIVRLLLLTGQRLNQIASLEKSWIHPDAIHFPASVMKSGREHQLPKTAAISQLLNTQTPLSERLHADTIPTSVLAIRTNGTSVYLFPNSSNKPFNAFSKSMSELRRDLNAKASPAGGSSRSEPVSTGRVPERHDQTIPHFTLHDLRRTFSTKMAEWNICPPHVVEVLLDHSTGTRSAIQRIYDRHTYLPEMRDALEKYHQRLLKLVLE